MSKDTYMQFVFSEADGDKCVVQGAEYDKATDKLIGKRRLATIYVTLDSPILTDLFGSPHNAKVQLLKIFKMPEQHRTVMLDAVRELNTN